MTRQALFLGIVAMAFFFYAPRTHAQTASSASDVSLEITPSSPAPFDQVSVTVSSFSVNLDKALISWRLDGQPKNSGTGAKTFSFTAGALGTTTTVEVSIVVDKNNRFDKKLIVQPSEIDLLWEAPDSYVPPFYEGKALPTPEGQIKIVAMPNVKGANGTTPKPGEFIYNWKKNFTAFADQSGYGKNIFTFRSNSLSKSESVSVQASTTGTNLGGTGSVTITPVEPTILFYEDKPLIGVDYGTALNGGFTLTSNEATIVAEPFYFSPNNPLASPLSYTWALNNNSIDTPTPKNKLVVRSSGSSGQAKVELSIENMNYLFQSAKKYFIVNLGTQ